VHQSLQAIVDELREVGASLDRMVEQDDIPALWTERPTPQSWSASEAIAHLTITTRRFLPIFAEVVDAAPVDGVPEVMKMDLAGRLLVQMMEPPRVAEPADKVVADFHASQRDLIESIGNMDGLDITSIRIASPFRSSMKYTVYSALRILAAHQRRHLWQAEHALDAVGRRR
jgi:hypothetical protein